MSMKESILNGIAKDCYNMGASIGAEKDLILVNYLDFDKEATLSPFNRQLNDDFGNKGGLTDIILKEGAETFTFEGTDYSVIPSVTTEIKENGNAWYSHSIAFTVYNKSSYARETLLMLGKARVVAITRDRSTGLFEVFGAEQGLKMSGLDRAYTGAQNSNFYTVTIATPDIAIIREKSLGELSLKLNGESGGGVTIPPEDNNLEYLLSLKEDKANKGVANGYTPLGADVKVPSSYLNIVNNLTTGGITALLSAEQGKIIGERIDSGLNNIRSERVITIADPVTRDSASAVINGLPSFEILDNEIPYFVTTNIEGEAGYKIELVGLGKGTYGVGGTSISSSQVRIIGLIDNGALGLNQILGLGNTGIEKQIILTDNTNTDILTLSKVGVEVKNGDNISILSKASLRFRNSVIYGNAYLLPPERTSVEDTSNTLPNINGTLAVSVNGVFADSDGNITLSPTGGAIPSWQQTLNVQNADVLVPFMKVSNDINESFFLLSASGIGADPVAFTINTPRKILLETGLNGRIELGNDLGILVDGKDKKVEIKADNTEGLFLDSGANGGISFEFNTGITLDARTQGLTLLGQTKGINIDSGLSLIIDGGLMSVNSLSQFNSDITVKNSTGLALITNVGNYDSFIKSDNVTKAGLIFQLPNPIAGTYTLATTNDFSTPNLNSVLGVGSIATDKTITLNSTTDLNTSFVSGFDGFVLNNLVSGVTKKSTLSINSFIYEDSSNNRRQIIDRIGFKSVNDATATYSQITPEGLFLQQNPSVSSFNLNLRGTYVSGSSKILELPNVNGVLVASINGVIPDSNGNVILTVTGGTQNLNQVLTVGSSAGALSIDDVTDLEILNSIVFNNSSSTSTIKQKTGSTITGILILPEKSGSNTIPLSVNSLSPDSTGLITLPITNFANGENLPVIVTPPTAHYTPIGSNLKGHLQGIDQALGSISQTTAGITNRIYFTGVTTTISAGTFYTSSALGKGAVASVQQNVTNNDNIKQYFSQDLVSIVQTSLTIIPQGTFSGQLSVQIDSTLAQQRYTVEVYKTDVNGNPIASGISGAPTGNLGVTVVTILDSGLVALTANLLTNITLSGILTAPLTLNVNERIRYHVSAEKVGTAGGNIVMSVFYGSNYNSFYDIPVIPTTDTVINRSGVTGITSSDAFNTLNTNKANLSSPTFTGVVISPALVLSSETASTLASFDTSKNIKSLPVASYPSLTEIAFVKGLTSAIQTQIDSKQVKDSQVPISSSTNVSNAWHGQTILFTSSCTITVPNSLINELDFSFRTMAGVTVTWAITSPFTWETTPSATPEKTVGHFMRQGSTNTIILDA